MGRRSVRGFAWRLKSAAIATAAGTAVAAGLGAGTAAAAGSAASIGQAVVIGSTTTYTQPPDSAPYCTSDTYVVPSGTYYLRVDVIGQAGSSGENFTGHGGGGGRGEEVKGVIPVTPGESLYANVAHTGSGGPTSYGVDTAGGIGGDPSYIANALTQNPRTLCGVSSFLVMAGGGGGGGGGGAFGKGGGGGNAGFTTGATGGAGAHGGISSGKGGGGGTQTAGGTGGSPASTALGGLAGTFFSGGCGGGCSTDGADYDGAGGGGGGYYGGGGGGDGVAAGGGGGGGGSSFVVPGALNVSGAPTSSSPSVSLTPVAEPPDAPTGVSAVASGPYQATITFTPPAIDGGAPIATYTVYAKAGDKSFNQTAGASGSPAIIRNLTPGQTYTFTVTATNQAGESAHSAPSNSIVAYRVPLAPTVTGVTPGNGSATVAFNENAADKRLGNPVTSYTVTARPGVNVTTGPGITATSAGSPITVTGLTNGRNYTVTVYATNAGGNGPQSAGKVVFPQSVPGAPTSVTAVNATPVGAGTGTVNLTFNAPADNGGRPILSYTAVSSPGGITVTAGAVTGSSTGSIQVTGLTVGTTYTFTVYATNGAGNGPASAPSNPVTPAGVGIPSPPLVPGASTLDQASYVSCLPPSDDGGSAITSYTVTSSPGGITASGPSCPILVEGLTDGTAYTFTVTATNADGGTSQPSQATAPVTPHVPSGTPPANDDYANAQPLTGASGSVTADNIGATLEPGEPGIQDSAGGASVWYTWTVPADGSYEFDTCSANPDFPTNIGLFAGSTVSSASEFGPGPSQESCPAGEAGSTLTFGPYSAGLVLRIKVDGQNELGENQNPAYEGVFTLEWSQLP